MLAAARDAIGAWVAAERRLALKPDRLEVYETGEPWVYLGFRVARAGLCVGPKSRRRFRRRLRRRAHEGPAALEATLLAMRGMVLFG